MSLDGTLFRICYVALREESVDRNLVGAVQPQFGLAVALRKESVDRNYSLETSAEKINGRSPQGEHG